MNRTINHTSFVTAGQLFTLLFIARLAMTLLYSTALSGISHLWDMLLPILVSMVIMLLLFLPPLLLSEHNRAEAITDTSVRLFGKSGNIVVVVYGVYFLLSFLYAAYRFRLFIDSLLDSNFHIMMIISALVIAAIYASSKGIEALARLSAIVLVLVLIGSISIFSLLMPNFLPENLQPIQLTVLDKVPDSVVFILSGMNTAAAFPIFAPQTKGKLLRSGQMWIILLFAFLAGMLILSLGTMGDYLETQQFQVYHITDGSGILQRLNPFFLVIIACCLFCHLSVMLLAFAECSKKLLPRFSGKWFCITGGILLLGTLAITADRKEMITMFLNSYVWCILAILLVGIIPLVVLIVDKVKAVRLSSRKLQKAASTTALLLAAVVGIGAFSGCTGTQLNQRLIIQGMGIDKQQDQYTVTLIVLDTDDREHENSSKLIITKGDTIKQSLLHLENERGRRILMSQCLFIMMNKEAAENSDDTLSYIASGNDILKTTGLMVSDKTAQETITSAVEQFRYTSENINVLSDSKAVDQPTVHYTVMDYLSSVRNKNRSMLFPYVVVDHHTLSLQTDGSYLVNRSGTGTHMNTDETAGTLIVNRNALHLTNEVSVGEKEVSYSIKGISANITPMIVDHRLDLQFNIQVALDQKYDKNITQKITDDIYRKVNAGVGKTILNSGSDVFLISRYLRSAYPDFYSNVDDWEKTFQNSRVRIRLSCC